MALPLRAKAVRFGRPSRIGDKLQTETLSLKESRSRRKSARYDNNT